MSRAHDNDRGWIEVAPGLSTAIRVSVTRLARRLRSERAATIQLSLTELAAMSTLERNGCMTVGELAVHERVQPPSMTRTIDKLENARLVRCERNPSDRRQILVDLTELGARLLERDRKRGDAWLAIRLRDLAPGERHVLKQAAAILERLAQT
jgi:DNA-binding MarR family transcriptional regulator